MARGDLRARLGTHRGVWVQTIYLGICGVFLLLSLPPEIGRFELREANLLLALLVVQVVAVTYLASGLASSELALEGEKAIPDLVLSTFSPRTIAVGKLTSSVLYAIYLVLIALPLVVLSAALRGASLSVIGWASVLTATLAAAAGVWGAWLAGRFTSDFTRSFVHWSLLAGVFIGTAMLPPPWSVANPLRLFDLVVRTGWTPALGVVSASYLIAAVAGAVLIAGHVRNARSETDEVTPGGA